MLEKRKKEKEGGKWRKKRSTFDTKMKHFFIFSMQAKTDKAIMVQKLAILNLWHDNHILFILKDELSQRK